MSVSLEDCAITPSSMTERHDSVRRALAATYRAGRRCQFRCQLGPMSSCNPWRKASAN